MKLNRRRTLQLAGSATLLAASGQKLMAQGDGPTEHVVEMLNRDPDNPGTPMVYKPQILVIQPGDTVRFVPVDRGHNAQTHEDMIPEGGTEFELQINEEAAFTIETEGAYGYFCTPHSTAGMVGLILCGSDLSNYEFIKEVRQRGMAGRRYEEIFEEADAMVADITSS